MASKTKKEAAPGANPEAEGPEPLGSSRITVEPLKMLPVTFDLTGKASSPYLQLKFSEKNKRKIAETQKQGEKAKNRKARVERDFDDDYKHALHVSEDGWHGIPATAFKNAMVSAFRLAGIPMTRAKLLVHVVADGLDAESNDALVRIQGKPEMHVGHVRNANGSTDLRVRGIWRQWTAKVTVEYDSTCIGPEDVLALMYRAGAQVGVGEGRPDSKKSCGMGMGLFDVTIAGMEKKKAA